MISAPGDPDKRACHRALRGACREPRPPSTRTAADPGYHAGTARSAPVQRGLSRIRAAPGGSPQPVAAGWFWSDASGWTVAWGDEHDSAASVTSWSGQYFPDEERIVAGWLFTTVTGPEDAWKATAVGQNTFRRVQP